MNGHTLDTPWTHPDGRDSVKTAMEMEHQGLWELRGYTVHAVVKWNILLESHEGELASPDSHKEVELCSAGNGKWAKLSVQTHVNLTKITWDYKQ